MFTGRQHKYITYTVTVPVLTLIGRQCQSLACLLPTTKADTQCNEYTSEEDLSQFPSL